MPFLICSRLIVVISFFFLGACSVSFTGIEYKRGIEAVEQQNYLEALKHFRKVLLRAPESELAMKSAREAARISLFETKQYAEAIFYFSHLVKFSQNESERRESQQRLAETYFEKLANYSQAVAEYNNLLLLRNSNIEIVNYRFTLARAYFYLNQFTEAKTEIESALKLIGEDEPKKFDLLMFLGNIYFNTKKEAEAVKVYEQVISTFPERAKKDNVAMNIIVCYEELEQFDDAIERLEELKKTYLDPEFIDLKIKRLKERKANLPGSRGLRK